MNTANIGIKGKLVFGIGIPILMLSILGGISYFSLSSIKGTFGQVEHTHDVLAEANAIISSAVDMETGMRGYLLAGENDFLTPYITGEKATYEQLAVLRETVSDNPPQVARLEEVEKTLRAWQKDVTEPNIQLRRDIGDADTMNDMADLVGEARGKVFFDKFRGQIGTFIEREATLLKARRTEFATAQSAVQDNFGRVVETVGWVDHTHQVVAAAAEALSHAVDMETGMRGFLLAGEEDFLEPYNNGKAAFFEGMAALQETVSDNPAQVKLLEQSEGVIKSWTEQVSEPAISLRRAVNDGFKTRQDVDAYVSAKKGKKFFDAFRANIATFTAREKALMSERAQTMEKAQEMVSSDLEVMRKNESWVTHTYEVIENANEILSAAVDMETGMRGYLLAGQEGFLAPYNAGGTRFGRLVGEMQETVSDNPAQVQLMKEINETVEGWTSKVTNPMIELRRKIGNAKTMDDMADLIGEAHGKQYFDKFRVVMGEFKSIEQGLMDQRKADSESTISSTNTMIFASVAGAILFGVLIGFFIIRNLMSQLGGEPDEVNTIVNRIAEGDLSVKLSREAPDGSLYAATGLMVEKLSQVIEQDIQSIVDAAREGDLSRRIDLEGKKGFFQSLSSGVNDLVQASEQVVGDTVRVFGAMSRGDLTQTIDADYRGSFNSLKEDANATVVKLNEVLEEDIQPIIDSARAGELNRRISMEGKEGFFAKLSGGINELVDVNERVVNDTVRMLGAMAEGDMTQAIEADYQGAFGQLKRDANATAAKLTEVIGGISNASDTVHTGADEISQGNTNLSQRTEEQASSLEETASSMEEMTSTVKQNAENAREANQLARGAREQAEGGGEVVSRAVVAMDEINESSKKIAAIIGVIDEIAFQTNLLALNAAVEAARAGEQGRGFAVVATEVRNLAQRSATAAKEIKALIQDSAVKVEGGSKLVNDSGETLKTIVGAVKKVSDIVAEIAAASNEQTSGIEQVNKAIMQMDETTQQNAALVEEAASASEAMGEQARVLNELVGFFTVDQSAQRPQLKVVRGKEKGRTRPSAQASGGDLSVGPEVHTRAAGGASGVKEDDWEEF